MVLFATLGRERREGAAVSLVAFATIALQHLKDFRVATDVKRVHVGTISDSQVDLDRRVQ